jgi:hypothetical protein|tara:strand:- start:4303 stop:4971 length:669 start_codon:yes stop_codon:yes gene_type:complete
MIISKSNLYKLISDNDYKTAILYENDIEENSRPFETIRKQTSDNLTKRLKELESVISGKFTILLGKGTRGEQKRNMTEVQTEFYETVIDVEPTNLNGVEYYENSANINRKVDELVKQKLDQLEKEREVQELKNKLAELDTMQGKISYFLQGFITKMMTPENLNTMNGFNNVQMNGQEQATIEDNLAVIVNYFGEDNIDKFAKKIKNGQANAVKPIIINFLNS